MNEPNIEKVTIERLKEMIARSQELNQKHFGTKKTFKILVVCLYVENTEYPACLEILTNRDTSGSVRHWFPVFELDLGEE